MDCNFWEGYLHALGVLSKQRAFVFEPPIRYRTRAECEQIRLDFDIVQGHRFKADHAATPVRCENWQSPAD